MTMGEKILNMRKARGWSQEELAERVGVTRQAVSRWESGSAKPDADKIIAVCDLFGVSADYLLRDMATGEAQRTEQMGSCEEKRAKPWIAWALTGFGAVTLFVLRILASVNRVYISPVHELSSDGTVSIVHAGYYSTFGDYVKNNDLVWLTWMAAISIIAGAAWLLWLKYKRRKEDSPDKE